MSDHGAARRSGRTHGWRWRAARALACAVTLPGTMAGCYQTVEVPGRHLAADDRVIFELTPRGADDMARLLGPNVARVEGIVNGTPGDTIELAMIRSELTDGTDNLWKREHVRFPSDAVRRVSERRMSKARSWLLVGGLAGAAALLGGLFGSGGAGGEGRNPGEQPPA